MRGISISAYELAQRFTGLREVEGKVSNPQIMAMLQLDAAWPSADEIPWCSAFVNYISWLLRLPRSKSLAARSWLEVGLPIPVEQAEPGLDVVILRRGDPMDQTRGHVGFFGSADSKTVWVLGGNQEDSVNLAPFNSAHILGVRRLA
jgi:uncharacterized protein (TIGR02594 family)